MSGTPEKETFDVAKSYVQIQFIQQRPPLDFELNEAQEIVRTDYEENAKDIFGTGAVGDAFSILPGVNQNEFSIRKGVLFYKGRLLRVFQDVLFSGLATPPAASTYKVYCDFKVIEIDSTIDPNIVSPTLGAESAIRKKIDVTFGFTIDAAIPQPLDPTVTRFRIGRIQRAAGDPNITVAMIVDERLKLRQTYIRSGSRAYVNVGLTFFLLAGKGKAGSNDWTTLDALVTMPASSARYFWIDEAGALQNGGVVPVDGFNCPLYYVVSDVVNITTLEDLRLFASQYQVVEDDVGLARGIFDDFNSSWYVGHNPDGTHKPGATVSGSITKADVVDLKVVATTPPTLQLYVYPGVETSLNGIEKVSWSGGLTPPIFPPLFNKRIDLVVQNEWGTIEVVSGLVISATPVPPPYPQDKRVLCEVEVRAADAWIANSRLTDVRPWVNVPSTSSCSSGSRHIFSFGTANRPYQIPVVAGAGFIFYTHSLGTKPVVYILDAVGNVVPLPVAYVDDNTFSVNFGGGPFTGTVVYYPGDLHHQSDYLVPFGLPGTNGYIQAFPGKVERLSYSLLATPGVQERIRIQLDNVNTVAYFDITPATPVSGTIDLRVFGVNFIEGQVLSLQAQQIGVFPFVATQKLEVHLVVTFNVPVPYVPPLYDLQTVPGGVPLVYNLNGSYEPGNHSLMVHRNGKLVDLGLVYLETSPTQVTFIPSSLVAGDKLLFSVPVIHRDGTSAPRLFEAYLAAGGEIDIPVQDIYHRGINSLQVWRNGKLLVIGEYMELDSQTIRLIGFLASAGDRFTFREN